MALVRPPSRDRRCRCPYPVSPRSRRLRVATARGLEDQLIGFPIRLSGDGLRGELHSLSNLLQYCVNMNVIGLRMGRCCQRNDNYSSCPGSRSSSDAGRGWNAAVGRRHPLSNAI